MKNKLFRRCEALQIVRATGNLATQWRRTFSVSLYRLSSCVFSAVETLLLFQMASQKSLFFIPHPSPFSQLLSIQRVVGDRRVRDDFCPKNDI